MSIFGTILSKVFGSHHPAAASPEGGAHPSDGAPPTAPTSPAPPPDETEGTTTASQPGQQSTGEPVDVAKVLDGMASHAGQKLDWRHSIVDLMKLLDMDSSLTARKELAHELHYAGDDHDSASMNIWLHKQVMTKFAEHGGHLPPELKG